MQFLNNCNEENYCNSIKREQNYNVLFTRARVCKSTSVVVQCLSTTADDVNKADDEFSCSRQLSCFTRH